MSFLVLISGCAQREGVDELYDERPPEITEYMKAPSVLVFSKTMGWRHNEGIAGADLFFAKLSEERGYGLFTTSNGAVFNGDDLAKFDVVVFNNVSGEVLNTSQREAFKVWLLAGGGWIGLHGSGAERLGSWDWYHDALIGADFIGHIMAPQIQNAKIHTLVEAHPVLEGVQSGWEVADEWYSFDKVPDQSRFKLLLGLDEGSYSPQNTVVDRWPENLEMGDLPEQHPIAWASCHGAGRAVYSAIGHGYENYENNNYALFMKNAFDWVAGTANKSDCP
ncbi:ThuA domain-containing protein [Hirschia litorea]|uniref:ThuA domain-containing protein n=1 Tax=Hirschia litorea TaxID=1199156 RepID=UPI0036D2CE8E